MSWSARCNFHEHGQPRCTETPLYRVELHDCEACHGCGFVFCIGHRACLTHAAEARADEYMFTANSQDIVPVRLHSLPGAAS